MDLYFQSGEFYAEGSSTWWTLLELFISFLGILAGALVSIFVFWKGRRIEINSENERLNELEIFVKNYIRDLKIPIEKQVKSIEQTVEKLKSTSEQDYSPDNLVNLHMKGLLWINRGDLYKIFVTRKIGDKNVKAELFREFNAKCDYIDAFASDYKETFDFFMKKYEKYESDWNQNFKLITMLRNRMNKELLANLRINKDFRYPFADAFNKLFVGWAKIKDYREPFVASKELLAPIIELCEKSEMDDHTLKFIEISNECLHAQDNLLAIKGFVSTNFGNMKDKLLEAGQKLNEIVDKYDELKTDNSKSPSFIKSIFQTIE
jgi:hypothetical protein